MREPERFDLSALDPSGDSERWERMVGQIMWRSSSELQRRQSSAAFGLFDGLVAWARPALATAAALTLISLVTMSRLDQSNPLLLSAYVRSPDLPAPMTLMIEEGEAPSVLDLLVINGEN